MSRKILNLFKAFFLFLLFVFLFCMLDLLIYNKPADPKSAEYWFFGYWVPREPEKMWLFLKGFTPLIAFALFYFPRRKKEIRLRRREEYCGGTPFPSSNWMTITLHSRAQKTIAVFLLIIFLLHYVSSIFLSPGFSPFCLPLILFLKIDGVFALLYHTIPNAILTLGIKLFGVSNYTYRPIEVENVLVLVEMLCFLAWYCLFRILFIARQKAEEPSLSER